MTIKKKKKEMSACGILQMNNGWRVGVGHLSPKYQGNFSSFFTYLSFPSPILMKVYMCVSWKSAMVLWEQSWIPNGPLRLFVFLVSLKTYYIYLLAAFIFRFQVPIKIKQTLWDNASVFVFLQIVFKICSKMQHYCKYKYIDVHSGRWSNRSSSIKP